MDQVALTAHGQQQKMRAVPAAPRRYDGQNGNPVYDHQAGGHYGTFSVAFFLALNIYVVALHYMNLLWSLIEVQFDHHRWHYQQMACMKHELTLSSQVPPQPYVTTCAALPHVADFWCRLPPKAMRPTPSCSPARGRMYDTTWPRAETCER